MSVLELDVGGTPWRVGPGEQWVVTGPAASGKTWLCARLARRYPDAVALVTFGHQAASAGMDWAAARWHASVGYDSPTVAEALTYEAVNDISPFEVRDPEPEARAAFAKTLAWAEGALALRPLLPRRTLALSNGEQRRLMLARAILRNTPALALDDPFAGLDPAMQRTLRDALGQLAAQGRTLILATRNEDEIPPCVTHRLRLRACAVAWQGPFRATGAAPQALTLGKNPPSLPTPEVLRVRGLRCDVGGRELFGVLKEELHRPRNFVFDRQE